MTSGSGNSWLDTVMQMTRDDIAKMKASMKTVLAFPGSRGIPVGQQVQQAVAQPEQYPADARAVLAKKLYAQYGEQARNVLPYLGFDETTATDDTSPDPFTGFTGGF